VQRQIGNQMIFEGAYGALSPVDAVFLWGNSLKLGIVL
jgi:hypothetical protein